MEPILFCNIGWMSRYEGLSGRPDKIVGGGKWVVKHGTGHEVCNFLMCPDGYVYGHVETIKGKTDRKINVRTLGGIGESVKEIDVVWTATDPDEGGRKVVGWYRNATVFRERQDFPKYPSKQHRRDELRDYRISALAHNARRLQLHDRTLTMPRGLGWMGHTPWWMPSKQSLTEVQQFVAEARALMDGGAGVSAERTPVNLGGKNSSSAASDAYVRYVRAYEIQILPRHNGLQMQFQRFLSANGATELTPDRAGVDLRFHDAAKGLILAEIKPCDRANARYAIRTAMGQLLDYQQREKGDTSLLIVVEKKPEKEDRLLATSNGFGIAYPVRGSFGIFWPAAP